MVTEDNDVFLFGARSVYRHLFDQKHDVEVYSMDDVEAELRLSRADLVGLAQACNPSLAVGPHVTGPALP